jgi:hypothetical protein
MRHNSTIHWRKTLQRPALFALAGLALLYLIRELQYVGIRKNKTGEFAKLREAFLESHPCNILILGSSRAECQFYPPILDSVTGLRTFNLGLTGATMQLARISLEAYLENSPPPKYVLLHLDLHSLTDSPDTVHHFPRYFPFLANKKLYAGLQESDARFLWFKNVPLYSMPYSGTKTLDNSIRGWLNKPGKYDSTYVSGFTPCESNPLLGDLDTCRMPVIDVPIPSYVFQNMNQIKSICDSRKIKLIVVISPVYKTGQNAVKNYAQIESDFNAWCVNSQTDLINMGNDTLSENKGLYADPAHLNIKGAILFSQRFSDHLLQYLPK